MALQCPTCSRVRLKQEENYKGVIDSGGFLEEWCMDCKKKSQEVDYTKDEIERINQREAVQRIFEAEKEGYGSWHELPQEWKEYWNRTYPEGGQYKIDI